MAVALYYTWDRLGRPLEPCQPIRDTVNRLKIAFPRAAAANQFSWYANEAHYQAEPPQDHTPFSATGWPLPSPQWVVFATDIMHSPDLGVDCDVLFAYWIVEARAGRMPWLKYMIWRGKRYDKRNNWYPVSAAGHYDHVHQSHRTDHRYTGLGSWSVVPPPPQPPQEDDMQCLVRYTDDPVAGRVWLADRMLRRVVPPAELVDDPANTAVLAAVIAGTTAANGPVVDISGFVGGPLANGGKVYQSGGYTGPNRDAWGAQYPPDVAAGGGGVTLAQVREQIAGSAIVPPDSSPS